MTIGRPLSFDREQALDRVADVFRERGFEGASLQNLLSATGLSKSSLYQQYGNKQELFDQCLARYADAAEADMRAALAKAASGRDFVAGLLQQIVDEPTPVKGCLIFNTASDLSQLDPHVAAKIRQVFVQFRAIIIAAMEQDQANGKLAQASSPKDLANYLMATMGGLRTLMKGGMNRAELSRSCQLILKALD
ncbi:MAG: TetR/AcrR family transcriptional regulator [Oceanococcus sp.]